jgi:putative endonuclease
MGTKELGNLGEKIACEYLVKKGYKIIGRNYRINFGEIDIIARKKGLFADKTIHFVEVKALSGRDNFYPEEHVDYKKQQKYKKLTEIWLQNHKYPQNIPYQVDIAAITIVNNESKINYFENVVTG